MDLKSAPFGRKGSLGPMNITQQTSAKNAPAAGPRGVRVESRIGIQAPAEVIWEIIADLERWAEWNPTYPRAAGQIRIGEVLSATLVLPGQPPQELKPRVLDWVPNEQLHWELRLLAGAIRTTRYIEIQQLPNAGCIVDNGEVFGGLLGPSLGKRMGGVVRRGFHAMNEALKERAEARVSRRV